MTLSEARRERITLALFFAIGFAGLAAGAYAKQTDNPNTYAATSAARG